MDFVGIARLVCFVMVYVCGGFLGCVQEVRFEFVVFALVLLICWWVLCGFLNCVGFRFGVLVFGDFFVFWAIWFVVGRWLGLRGWGSRVGVLGAADLLLWVLLICCCGIVGLLSGRSWVVFCWF